MKVRVHPWPFKRWFEDQGAHGPALVRDLFLFGQEDGRFLGATERRIMGVRGGLVHVVGRQGGGKIQSSGHHGVLGGEPALRSQEGVGFLGVVIEDGFQIRFVGITVVLRADEGAVQVTGQLLDEGVGQIVGRVQHVTGVYIGAILFPQTQLHGKITATQIDEGIHTASFIGVGCVSSSSSSSWDGPSCSATPRSDPEVCPPCCVAGGVGVTADHRVDCASASSSTPRASMTSLVSHWWTMTSLVSHWWTMTSLVSHWWTMTSLVSHWWTMTSTHKAGRAGHAIKADVGGAGFQTERDKMAESRPNPVTFDRALQREQTRQKRHRQGGKQQELSQRLDQQAEIPAVPAKRKKKTPAKETFLKDSAVLHTLGPTRPASPSKEVASMLSSLRPPSSPYGTPPDLPSTIEELLEQVPQCAEGSPLEAGQDEKKENPLAWNLPPAPSNWHDTPPKKGVPYAVLFGRDPIYVYDDDPNQAGPSPDECPFHQLPLPHHVSKQGWAYVK